MAEAVRGWDREGGRPGPSAAAAAALRPGAQGGQRAGGVCARAGAASESVQSWGWGWGEEMGAGRRDEILLVFVGGDPPSSSLLGRDLTV